MFRLIRAAISCGLLGALAMTSGCASPCGSCHSGFWGGKKAGACACDGGVSDGGACDGCSSCGKKSFGKKRWGKCGSCGHHSFCCGGLCGHCVHRSLAIPEGYPVGAVERAHFHQMQTNAEAADFILFQKDFVLDSAELTPDGKDKILEIAARMRSAPFPVVVERTYNNGDPELDAHRRAIVSQILTDLGNADANNRTFVSMAYGPGKISLEAAPEYYMNTYMGLNNLNMMNGSGMGGGGFGGGGGGFGGGGGGGGGGFGGGGMGGAFGM